jgi:hypothetical protein
VVRPKLRPPDRALLAAAGFLSIEDEANEIQRVKRHLSHVVAEPYSLSSDTTFEAARAVAERLAVTGF